MSQWLRGQFRSARYRTALSGFWQVPRLGAFDPPIPNLPISLTDPPIPARIELVGVSEWAGATSTDVTLSLTNLRGGIGTAAAANDIVVVVTGNSGTVSVGATMATSGYARPADITQSATPNIALTVFWKRMGATPDTSAVVNGSLLITRRAVAMVFRNVDTTTALDVTTTTGNATGTGIANPPAILPATVGARIVTALFNMGGASLTPPADAEVLAVDPSNGTTRHISVLSRGWAKDQQDFAPWTGHADSVDYGWIGVTLALRPKQAVLGERIQLFIIG